MVLTTILDKKYYARSYQLQTELNLRIIIQGVKTQKIMLLKLSKKKIICLVYKDILCKRLTSILPQSKIKNNVNFRFLALNFLVEKYATTMNKSILFFTQFIQILLV